MKASRLILYAAAGMIAGLLIENKALIVKAYAKKKADKAKRKVSEVLS
jgi:hypothetical protein